MNSATEPSPPASTHPAIPDQWLLIGLLLLGAVLTETTIPDLIRLPLTTTYFVVAHPDTWLPLLVVAILIAGAIVLERSGRARQYERLAWLVAGAAGIAGVVWFFRAGDLDWHTTQDWRKEWTYHAALRESFRSGHLPWFLNETFQGTDRFFANPETNVVPLTILLAWIEVPAFFVLHCVALLTVGVVASYHLARRLHLGPIASLTFLAMFLMNGHLIAHLHTGHGQWVAYFAFPCMFLFLCRAALGDMGGRTQAGLALGLTLIEMVGGWHLFVWCVIYIGVFVAMDRTRWRFGASLGLLVAALSALRIVPALAVHDASNAEFVGSYQDLAILVGALVGEARNVTDGLDWWEYDAFVGWVGLALVSAGLTAPLSRTWAHPVAALWVPSVVMLVLSIFNIYEWTLFQLPGFVSERVASRLLIVGLLGFTLIGCVQLNMWLARRPLSAARLAALACAGLMLATQLVVHTNGLRPAADRGVGPPGINVVSKRPPDTAYAVSVGAGALVTLIGLGMAVRMWRRSSLRLKSGGH